MKTDWLVMINTFVGFALCFALGCHFSLRWDHRVIRALAIFFFGQGIVMMLAYLSYIGVNDIINQGYRTGFLNLLLILLLLGIRKGILQRVDLPHDLVKRDDNKYNDDKKE